MQGSKSLLSTLSITSLLIATANITQAAQLNQTQAQQYATDAYIYGYPLITMNITRQVMTNVPNTTVAMAAPMGQFANVRTFPDASFKTVTAPNADTLYSVAWSNLAREPYVLHVPDEHGRYYMMPMLSAWTNVFASPGTRTTGTAEHNFAIVGPHWTGTLPKGVTEIKSPTDMVWIIGRTYCTGTAEDYQAVHAIQDQYNLTPLSAYGKTYTPPTNVPIDTAVDMNTPPRDQVNAMPATTYFSNLAMLMKDNPPAKSDSSMVYQLEKLGIKPGQAFDSNNNSVESATLQQSAKNGLQKITDTIPKMGIVENGWHFLKTGNYGINYLNRAAVTYVGLGANLLQDAIYPTTSVDSNGKQLNGVNHYLIHFAKGQMPPVRGFWSLTMYDPQYFFVANPLNRYRVNSSTSFKYNADGSLDIYIQNDDPGSDKESNWLPAPAGNFNLMFRFYWPKDSIINGSWKPPVVQKV